MMSWKERDMGICDFFLTVVDFGVLFADGEDSLHRKALYRTDPDGALLPNSTAESDRKQCTSSSGFPLMRADRPPPHRCPHHSNQAGRFFCLHCRNSTGDLGRQVPVGGRDEIEKR